MAYQQEAIRQGGVTTQMARCRRNPSGWADWRRIAASFVVAVLLAISTASSSLLALLAIAPSATMRS